jgi:hypothetical protein
MALMTKNGYKTALLLVGFAAGGALLVSAYAFGKGRTPAEKPAAVAAKRTQILLGRLVRIEPLHLYVESVTFGAAKTYDVTVGPGTYYAQLLPWAPGEKERADKTFWDGIAKQHLKPGDPIPPPPLTMKSVPLDPDALRPGMDIGIMSPTAIDPNGVIFAAVVRPLIEDEARTGQVANTFPAR